MKRIISYQAADGKWHDLEVFDLIDPSDECGPQLVKRADTEAHMYCDDCDTHWRARIPVCPACGMLGIIGRV